VLGQLQKEDDDMFNCKIRSIMNLNEQSEVSERNQGEGRGGGIDVMLDPPSAMMSEFESSQAFHFA
jgi:hypothetical protein